jgi:Rad3-related DNA helicase
MDNFQLKFDKSGRLITGDEGRNKNGDGKQGVRKSYGDKTYGERGYGNKGYGDYSEGEVENGNIDGMDIWDEEMNFDNKRYNLGDDVSGFNLYKNGERLSPLVFSNGKTQEDVVNEIFDEIKKGKKVIFVKGVCGTGKSAIALNLAKLLGKASIIVPGKALQKQYFDDYGRSSYVLKKDNTKLKIKVITGRNNHKCLYCRSCSADDNLLPCKIEIKDSNMEKLREYLRENQNVRNDLELKEIRRMSVAVVCPYWSPILPTEYDMHLNSKKKNYKGLKGIEFTIHNRKEGCTYYNQFNSYVDADAIIFNSYKYKFESLMNRKPETEIEVIDECDEFLDSFSNVTRVNLTRFVNSLNNFFSTDRDVSNAVKKMISVASRLIYDNEHTRGDIKKVVDNDIVELFRIILENSKIVNLIDDESYFHSVYEAAAEFEDFFDESFVCFENSERGVIAGVVTTNLAKKFEELVDKNKVIVMMSGTIHSEKVLKDIFGIENFSVIEAETVNQGEVEAMRTGFEFDCKYSNFSSGNFSRESYLVAFDKAVEKSVKPALIHVNAFDDLPSDDEKQVYGLKNLLSRTEFLSVQDLFQERVAKFKRGEIDVLFSTKTSRGMDFPKEQCNSIIFTKYPNPNVNSVFWKILNQTHPQYYWEFYKDKAKREFLQKIYRGVRSHDDHIYILSPDLRVLNAVSVLFN